MPAYQKDISATRLSQGDPIGFPSHPRGWFSIIVYLMLAFVWRIHYHYEIFNVNIFNSGVVTATIPSPSKETAMSGPGAGDFGATCRGGIYLSDKPERISGKCWPEKAEATEENSVASCDKTGGLTVCPAGAELGDAHDAAFR
jgi:hypothetical protein